MKLIWTYDDTTGKSFLGDEHRTTLINYYILSITNAKKLDYETIIYTTLSSKHYFEGIVDEIIIINRPYDTKIWDYLKIYVLENRNDDFCLIDGDLILYKKLPNFDVDVVFDTIEDDNWEFEYAYIVKQFEELEVKEVVDFWSSQKILTMNLGILYFNNFKIKDEYLKLWKKMNIWLNNQTADINLDLATMVISQYLLTLICRKENADIKSLRISTNVKGEFYNHYIGDYKFTHNVVPLNNMLKINKTLM